MKLFGQMNRNVVGSIYGRPSIKIAHLGSVNKHGSRKRRVVMRFVHATGLTWYKVLYKHTMHVISLSNISIKTNFKQITRVELKCVQYSEEDYIMCMTSRYYVRSFTNVGLLYFVSHSNGVTSCQSSSAENVSCNVAPFFYHHSVWWYNILYQTGDFL